MSCLRCFPSVSGDPTSCREVKRSTTCVVSYVRHQLAGFLLFQTLAGRFFPNSDSLTDCDCVLLQTLTGWFWPVADCVLYQILTGRFCLVSDNHWLVLSYFKHSLADFVLFRTRTNYQRAISDKRCVLFQILTGRFCPVSITGRFRRFQTFTCRFCPVLDTHRPVLS